MVHAEQQEMHTFTNTLSLDRNSLLSLRIFNQLQSNASLVYLHVIVCKRDPNRSAYDLPDLIRLKNLYHSGNSSHHSVPLLIYITRTYVFIRSLFAIISGLLNCFNFLPVSFLFF
ncbi:hypothetical protein EON65_30360 [archaeon]|nr:MAG: hypothetical protein EON65_30360 [archaeon]